jgi:hypothetical protein
MTIQHASRLLHSILLTSAVLLSTSVSAHNPDKQREARKQFKCETIEKLDAAELEKANQRVKSLSKLCAAKRRLRESRTDQPPDGNSDAPVSIDNANSYFQPHLNERLLALSQQRYRTR